MTPRAFIDCHGYMISNNRVEWAVCKYAVNGLGAQLVPMYEAQAEKDW